MKIIAFSDTHGYLPVVNEPFDLLLHCGDACPAHDHYFAYQDRWLRTEFVDWIKGLPFKDENSKVVMIPGNHDFAPERYSKKERKDFTEITEGRLVMLKNEGYEFKRGEESVKIFGTPYCKIFGSWAFMVPNDRLERKYSEIPEGLDILISHDAPTLGDLGLIQEGYNQGTQAGNTILDSAILQKKPTIFFCGHIHSGNHNFSKVGDTYMANVSFVNERYYPVNNSLVFEYKDKTILDCSYPMFETPDSL